jgi:Sec-independent protein translocase protein TatA
VKDLLARTDVTTEALVQHTEKLGDAAMELGKAIYEAQMKTEQDKESGAGTHEDGTVDADYEPQNDKKNKEDAA